MRVLFFYRDSENLGVEYLIAKLKEAGHQCFLIFDSGVGELEYELKPLKKFFNFKERMLKLALYYKPDLIVFSSVTNMFPWVAKIGRSLKKIMKVPIIVGGIHPTIVPEYVISHEFVDMICIGEGEDAIVELADSMEKGKINYNIRNLWFKKEDGTIIRNEMRPLIQDLDSIPFPDKNLFRQYGAFSIRYYIITSRGCPNSCTYCINHQLKKVYKGLGRYQRRRSVDNVINELKIAKSKFNFRTIYFYDDIFIDNDDWLEEFTQKYPQEIGIKFKCLLHPNSISEKRIKLLKKAGCVDIDIGLESGDELIRKNILHRNISNRRLKNSILTIKKNRIRVSTLNLIGLPEETPKEMYETYKMNAELKPNGVLINELYPYPETIIFNDFKRLGLIDNDLNEKILKGEDNYRKSGILLHPFADSIKRFQYLTPIAVKFPKILQKFILNLPPNTIMRIFDIFTITSSYNAYIKLREFLTMLIHTHQFYEKAEEILKKHSKKLEK